MANELVGKYEGSVLICGSAPSLNADYQHALAARPGSIIIAINEAASILFADFLATLHPEDAAAFKSKSINPRISTISGQKYNAEHDINFWFDGCNSGGTSAGSAIKMAKAMGFDEIILCGCPMTGGNGYFHRKARPALTTSRFGDLSPDANVIAGHQHHLTEEAEAGDYSMVKSMGGWTAKLFGEPDFKKAL